MEEIVEALTQNINISTITDQISDMAPFFAIIVTVGFGWTLIKEAIDMLTDPDRYEDMAIKDAERMSDEEWDFIYGAEVRRD